MRTWTGMCKLQMQKCVLLLSGMVLGTSTTLIMIQCNYHRLHPPSS